MNGTNGSPYVHTATSPESNSIASRVTRNGSSQHAANRHTDPSPQVFDHAHGHGEADDTSFSAVEPIAIIGMGMRLPGRVHNATQYWDMLVKGKSGRCRVPKDRYNIDTWYGPGRTGHVNSQHGYFLDELNLAHIDPSFWSFGKQEAEMMDPRQRLFLEVVYEAFESAGATNWRGKDIGMYVGAMGDDWADLEKRDDQSVEPQRADVYGDYITANRASYEFDLKGPSVVVRTACSSSLVALHMACQDLRSGDCTSAVVGGVNLILSHRDTVAMTEQGVLSPTGTCKSFDAEADGYARGEGVSAIYIKKLTAAVSDGDPIRAVIRSTCVGGDGKTAGMTTPDPASHERLMRRGHNLAGLYDLSKTAMIECHGTGTAVGDLLEVSAVASVWGEHGIYIGSVKPNIGHGEGASGLSSIMKMVLALENSTIPPNINLKTPNPAIPWKEAKLVVPTKSMPWPADRRERVSVNSFGIGGANSHVLLESAASMGVAKPRRPSSMADMLGPRLLVFSAKHQDSLQRSAQNIDRYLTRNPGKLTDLAYSLGSKREIHPHRAFCVTDGLDGFEVSQVAKLSGNPPKLVWTFTGQGAQWAQMGKELLEKHPLVKQRVDYFDDVIANLPDPPPWTLRDLILAPKQTSRLYEAELSQPCLIALQIALVDLLHSWNVRPAALVGHSSGETAAAYAAGAITAEDAILIGYYRGQITPKLKASHNGSMAAVGLGRDQVEQYLRPGVIVGCENSPSSVTLSGEVDVLETVIVEIHAQRPDVPVRGLRVECGFHSGHMQTVKPDYEARLVGLPDAKHPSVPFYSTLTGKRHHDLSRSYWARNLVSPVLFNTAVRSLLADIATPAFIEIGPHSALAGPIRQILQAENMTAPYIPTLVRNQDGLTSILKTAGQLWLAGIDIDLSAVNPLGEFLTDLPTYPWHYDGEYWFESRVSREWRLRKFDHHELLGTRVLESGDAAPTWRCNLRVEDVPWLRDHEFKGDVLLPAAGYVAMAGEAVRQLAGSADYSVRRVSFESSLVLTSEPVEVVTIVKPAKLSTSAGTSQWHDFSISSLNGDVWATHVSGQCRAGREYEIAAPGNEQLPRKVSPASFYGNLKRHGINYGPSFRGLSNIRSHVTERRAVGTVQDQHMPSQKQVFYAALHPTSIDSAFHPAMVAACCGLERRFKTVSVPQYVEEMYIGKPSGSMKVVGEVFENAHGGETSNLTGVCHGKVVFHVQGLEVAPFGGDFASTDDDPHAGAIIEWKSDVDLTDPGSLIRSRRDKDDISRLVDRLVLACIVESRNHLQGLNTTQPHLLKYRKWLEGSYTQAVQGRYPKVADCTKVAAMDWEARNELVRETASSCIDTEAQSIALSIYDVFKQCTAAHEAGQIVLQGNARAQAHGFTYDMDFSGLLGLLGHKKPSMRILEIGAGMGDMAASVLPALQANAFGERLYRSYMLTDISEDFFPVTKERFKDFRSIEYAVLDIAQDPVAQGFVNGSFDLVITSNVIHTMPDPVLALQNARKLLRPSGRLLLREVSTRSKAINYVMGALPEWRHLSEGGGEMATRGGREACRSMLGQAGFDGPDAAVVEGHLSTTIIAKPLVDQRKPTRLSVLCCDSIHRLVSAAATFLQEKGFELQFYMLGQDLPVNQPALCLLDLETPFLCNLTPDQYVELKKSLLSVQDSGMLWVTGAVQIGCADPNYSMIIGAARTIRRELSIDLVTLELESFNTQGWKAVADVLATFGARVSSDEDEDPDCEYVFSQGSIKVSRFHQVKVSQELLEQKPGLGSRKLAIRKPGALRTLHWKHADTLSLTGNRVEVETRAVGLNSGDIEIAMKGPGEFGSEGSGIIRSVGSEVTRLRVGDKVAFSSNGCLSTSVTLPETHCVRIPESLSFVEAASMPYAFGTAMYGLMELARLQKGQSVLIHSACGTVGLAAIQLAKMLEAEIFCTADTVEEIHHLMSVCGISHSHIFSCNNASFVPSLLNATGGQGVDIVLSSLSGEQLHASWKCTASFGVLVQIGKIDVASRAQIKLDLFERGRTFTSLDFNELMICRPLVCARLLAQAFKLLEAGTIQPIRPLQSLPAAKIEDDFRLVQIGEYIGKAVVTMPDNGNEIEVLPSRRKTRLRSDRTYVFVGGLGGLGQSTAKFLVEKGARHLIFFSRSASSFAEKNSDYFKEFEVQGCSVQVISGSVSNMDDVTRMVRLATLPIAGVMNAAMVLQDIHFTDMTFTQWQATVQPKVQGTWNLHNALMAQPEPLDFFFLFSSLTGIGGQIGQANYAAANTFLDAFVQYRHSLGLPCSTLDIGIMEDVGVLAREKHRLDALRATSLHFLHEQDLLDGLELMIARSHPLTTTITDTSDGNALAMGYVSHGQVAIGLRGNPALPMAWAGWKKDPRTSFFTNVDSPHQLDARPKPNANLKQFLRSCSSDPAVLDTKEAVGFLAQEIGATLAGFMMRGEDEIDLGAPLASLGVDSLVSVELRNWFKQKIGVMLTVVEIRTAASVRSLGEMTALKLAGRDKA